MEFRNSSINDEFSKLLDIAARIGRALIEVFL